MNTPRKLALTTIAAAGLAVGIANQAGAGVRWTIDQPTIHVDTRCDGNNAITNLQTNIGHDGLHVGDTIQATWTARPGCETTNIRIAAHATASLTFDPTETQPLIQASGAVLASSGRLVYTIPNGVDPGCQVQLDLINGDALGTVSPTSRYNEFAIGGQRSRLIAAGYAAGECVVPTTTTTTEPPTTMSTTITVSNSTPIPTTTFPVVDQTTPDLTPTPPPAEGPGSPELLTQRLPETGGRGTTTAKIGGLTTAAGMFALALSALRRRPIKENQS